MANPSKLSELASVSVLIDRQVVLADDQIVCASSISIGEAGRGSPHGHFLIRAMVATPHTSRTKQEMTPFCESTYLWVPWV